MPEPTREDLTIPARPYAIGPADQLNVDVFDVPDLSRTVTVDLAGQISLPLVGAMQVSGLTATELADLISERLRTNVRDPRVTVNVVVAANQVVTVDGAVSAPGVYPVQGRMSLMRAIARASSTTEFSKENHVVVFRRANGANYATLYDLRAIREGAYEDPEIFSNDVVVVGESQARRIFKDVLAASSLITTPIITLVR
jgi:polysaccharide export outer membrane protein